MPAFYCGIFGHKPTTGNYFSLNPDGVHAVLHESVMKWVCCLCFDSVNAFWTNVSAV
jgi:hypothetical protein